MRIGQRLLFAFTSVALVIAFGALVTRWQFLSVSRQAAALKSSDDQVINVYKINADLETLHRRLAAIAEVQNRAAFTASENALNRNLSLDIENAINSFEERGTPLPSTLVALELTLSNQFDAMRRLANSEDWIAIKLRLDNQLDAIIENVGGMVEMVDANVSARRAAAVREIEAGRTRAQLVLLSTAVLSLFVAVGFGVYVSRTIVTPLQKLESAAHLLAAGDFDISVETGSKDELGAVGRAFAGAATKLNDYYAALKFSNESLEQFAYAASHDLQEPIRSISLISGLIRKEYGESLDSEGQEYLDHLLDATRRMRELVNGILEYSRISNASEPSEDKIDTNEVVAAALENLHGIIAETEADVTCENLPPVVGNRLQLTQVFQNLVGNAIKYRADFPPRVHISARRSGGVLRFCVQDNGIGIPRQYHAQIFGIFKQLNRGAQGGAGVGLAITKRIVERHGGAIWVESEPGAGSAFYFTLRESDRDTPVSQAEKRDLAV